MKRWIEPKLSQLGVEMTMEDLEIRMQDHYCHNNIVYDNGNCAGRPNEHNDNGKTHNFTGLECEEHKIWNNGNSNCCCAPGIS